MRAFGNPDWIASQDTDTLLSLHGIRLADAENWRTMARETASTKRFRQHMQSAEDATDDANFIATEITRRALLVA